MIIEGKDKNHITFITSFIMIPLSLSTIGIGLYGIIILQQPILSIFIVGFGVMFFMYSLYYGKENKYTAILEENTLVYKVYPLFKLKKLDYKDVKKIIVTSSRTVLYGNFSCLLIERKGFKKALFFSSFSITKKDSFNNFVEELCRITKLDPITKTHNEIQKAISLIFK